MSASKVFQSEGQPADFHILCGGEDFLVHKAVICSKSRVFNAVCASGFKESTSGIFKMEDDELTIVKKMLCFIYTGDYSADSSILYPAFTSCETDALYELDPLFEALITHVRVYALADKYDTPSLSRHAKGKYIDILRKTNRSEDLIIAFLSSIPEIYASTPDGDDGLRKVAVKGAQNFRSVLKGGCSKIQDSQSEMGKLFQELLKDVPSFATDLVNDFMNTPARSK